MLFNRIFLLSTLLLVCLLCGCGRAAPDADGAAAPMPAGAPRDDLPQNREDVDGQAPRAARFLDELTFLGDSTTAHMKQRAPLTDGASTRQVWATASRYLNLDSRITYAKIVCPDTGEEATVAEAAARLKPRYLVITLGIDYGVYYYRDDPDTFRRCYEKLLDAVAAASPETRMVLQSIFPVGRGSKVITNEMVDRANETVRAIAAARGLPYADAAAVLRDDEGYLRPAYCYSEDGIHLTESAYAAVLDMLADMEPIIRGGDAV